MPLLKARVSINTDPVNVESFVEDQDLVSFSYIYFLFVLEERRKYDY